MAGESAEDRATLALAATVAEAAATKRQLVVCGSGSKNFYGNPCAGEEISTAELRGIVDYAPEELTLTARAATPLEEVDFALKERGQYLPFDPPRYGGGGTFGGAIAAGLAGPAKPHAGGVRDSILGVQIINGKGEVLNFGGKVVKNVAGYDVSRLMVGSLGTLGIITQATVKVLPRPQIFCTVVQNDVDAADAVTALHDYVQRSLPLAGSFYHAGKLHIRFAGGSADWAAKSAGGERMEGDAEVAFWNSVRDHTHPFFQQEDKPLWRISVPPRRQAAEFHRAPLASGEMAFEWNGAVYWQAARASVTAQTQATQLDGTACLFRRAPGMDKTPFLPPPGAVQLRLHRRLKEAFDPAGIFNVGKLYP